MSKTYIYTLNKEYSLQYTGFTVSSLISRGFTGHEHLDNVQLINMNGRLYDPIIARFLSPDNNVQMPDYTQNLNRYTYALNNPLIYTDPDGEWFLSVLAAIFFPPALVWTIPTDIAMWTGSIINTASKAGNIDNFGEGLGYFISGGIGAGIAVQGFGMAAPIGAAVTTFGNGVIDTDFITKDENGYNFGKIGGEDWRDIALKTGIGFATGYLGDKIGGKIADKINFKSDFWNLASERMIKGGITNGSFGYFNSTIVDGNKWNSKEALYELGIGFGSGIAMGFSYTFIEQKVMIPEFEKFKHLNWKISLHLKVNQQNYNFIMKNSYNPLMPPRIPIIKPNTPIYLPINR